MRRTCQSIAIAALLAGCTAATAPDAATAQDEGIEMRSKDAPPATAGPSDDVANATDLFARRWRLVAIAGHAIAAADPASRQAVAFSPAAGGARLSGRIGCNRVSAAATMTGSAIRFGPVAATKMACVSADDLRAAAAGVPTLPNTLEADFAAALQRTARYSIVDGTLRLQADDGSELVRFVAADR
ncbi:MAG: META domain-containing protein [Sphingomonadales bacterium]|nr:META domain-containing protein [Sphingomonadales bacterium]